MALSSNDTVSWSLPPRSLSHAVPHNKTTELNFNPGFLFPTDFPYDFDSLDSALSSPDDDDDDSALPSTDPEITADDENDFLAGLTLRLTHSSTRKLDEKSWVAAWSPESTLSGLGCMSMSSNCSPNGSSSSLVSSPRTTPFGGRNDTWDLISAAAGQIARLKTSNRTETAPNATNNSHARGLLAPLKSSSPVNVIKNPNLGFCISQSVNFDLSANTNQYQQYLKQEQILKAERQQVMRPTWASSPPQQIQNKATKFRYENARCGEHQQPQYAWPSLQELQHHQQKPQQQQRPVFVAGSGCGRRECAGTGVFLPRRYDNHINNPHDHRRKSDAIVARRNASITLRKGSLRAEAVRNHHHHGIHLPKEWTY